MEHPLNIILITTRGCLFVLGTNLFKIGNNARLSWRKYVFMRKNNHQTVGYPIERGLGTRNKKIGLGPTNAQTASLASKQKITLPWRKCSFPQGKHVVKIGVVVGYTVFNILPMFL